MKIRGVAQAVPPLRFQDIKVGDTFATFGSSDKEIYIKVGSVDDNPNAIDLSDGSWMMFKDEHVVEIDAEIVRLK